MKRSAENARPSDERILRITEIFLFVVLTAIIIYQIAFTGALTGGEGMLEVNHPAEKTEQVSIHSVSLQE